MRKILLSPLLFLLVASPAFARQRVFGWCAQGGVPITVGGVGSAVPPALGVYASCTVLVYLTGTTTKPSQIYSDNSGTTRTNPFTATSSGYWEFYVDNGRYDVVVSGGTPAPGISSPYTYADILAQDSSSPPYLNGYVVTAGIGLTANISSGEAYCGAPQVIVNYTAGTLSMTDSSTNYVYLDPAASCVPAANTSGFTFGDLPLATVVTSGGAISSITLVQTPYVPQPIGTDANGNAVAKQLNGILFADQFSSIQAALTAAGTNGTTIGTTLLGAGDTVTPGPSGSKFWDIRTGVFRLRALGIAQAGNGIVPRVLSVEDGNGTHYITNAVDHDTSLNITRFEGTPYSTGGTRYAAVRSDVFTLSGVDVQGGYAGVFVNNVHSTDSVGNRAGATHLGIAGNCSALDSAASASCTAINAVAYSAYTGAIPQTVNGLQDNLSLVRDGCYFGCTTGPYAVGSSSVLQGTNNGTIGMAVAGDSASSGKGWLSGVYIAGTIDSGVVITRGANSTQTTTGIWVASASTTGVYVGAKLIHPVNTSENPVLGTDGPPVAFEAGETALNSGISGKLRFTSTSAGGAEQTWDVLENTDTNLDFQYAGVTKFNFDSNGNAVFQGNVTAPRAQLTPVGFATLATCNAGIEGRMAAVNDANTATWGATITAGSSTNHVLAYCDGTNWTVAGK